MALPFEFSVFNTETCGNFNCDTFLSEIVLSWQESFRTKLIDRIPQIFISELDEFIEFASIGLAEQLDDKQQEIGADGLFKETFEAEERRKYIFTFSKTLDKRLKVINNGLARLNKI